jgi:ubiquinone/menaquinone biosynthesis C-methylase UbiE
MTIIGTGYNSIVICGVYTEPEVTRWLGSLVDRSLREGMTIVDCGCGNGRLAHYISKKINEFEYIGLEVVSDHGKEMVKFAKENFNDRRTTFGFIESELEKKAIDSADLVVFGSVFTHTTIEDTYDILDKYSPVMKRGGRLVFSALIKPDYVIGNHPAYHDNAFDVVYNTLDQYIEYADKNDLILNQIGESNFGELQHHYIYELLEKNDSFI